MSTTLDLNGGTTTLTAGTTTTYYQVTDTSVAHNGKLILGAGAVLRFDNKAGAGFASAASAIEVYCNGTSIANCAIISADPSATNLWTFPASGCLIDADYTEFAQYAGAIVADYFAFDNCMFRSTRYCTVEDLVNLTGSELERIELGKIVENATNEVISRLKFYGMSGGGGNFITSATLKLAIVGVITRHRMDGTMPSSLTMNSLSMKDNLDEAIKSLTADAYDLIYKYVMSQSGYRKHRYKVRILNR